MDENELTERIERLHSETRRLLMEYARIKAEEAARLREEIASLREQIARANIGKMIRQTPLARAEEEVQRYRRIQ
jgi:hypothetical protein